MLKRGSTLIYKATVSLLFALILGYFLNKEWDDFANWERISFDSRLKIRQSLYSADPDILILAKDRKTREVGLEHPELNWNPMGPLPRNELAKLIEFLNQKGVKAIILDLDFREAKPEDDILQKALQKHKNVYAGFTLTNKNVQWENHQCLLSQILEREQQVFQKLKPHALQFINVELTDLLPCYQTPLSGGNALTRFADNLAGIGSITPAYGNGDILRTARLLYRTPNNHYYTNLGFAPLINQVKINANSDWAEVEGNLTKKSIPLLNETDIYLDWKQPYLLQNPQFKSLFESHQKTYGHPILNGGLIYPHISVSDLLIKASLESRSSNTDLPKWINDYHFDSLSPIPFVPESGEIDFENKIVIYGDTIRDLHRTAISEATPGVEIVATSFDMLKNNSHFIRNFDQPLLWLFFGGLMFLCFTLPVSRKRQSLIILGMPIIFPLAYTFVNIFAFVYWGLSMPILMPLLMMLLSHAFGVLIQYKIEQEQNQQITSVFSKYVSPQVMSEILKSPETVMDKLKGKREEVTVMFTDIQEFTSTFENVDPEELVAQINEYFQTMVQIILNNNGTIDKYIGDSIMAFWGAPTPSKKHAQYAASALLEMQDAMRNLNIKWRTSGKRELFQGISLSSGTVFVGNFGADNNKSFTVMGSVVNLGSRLEGLTRKTGTLNVISEETAKLLAGNYELENIGTHSLKGFKHPVQAYTLKNTLHNDLSPVMRSI